MHPGAQDPALRHLDPRPSWQPLTTGPPDPPVLQKPRTAHFASSRIRVTCGFSYFFFLEFSSMMSTFELSALTYAQHHRDIHPLRHSAIPGLLLIVS